MTKNEIEELDIQENINHHVDGFKSFRFNAGAGAGKTYALIETLKHVTINKITATKSPQKVACITYTNVAVNEIKSRLGNSDIVDISTIHERLWEIIKRAQPELLICHKEKIEEAIEQVKQDLLASKNAKFFNDLDKYQQEEFIEFAMQTKELFYQSKNLKASDFRTAYENNTEIHKPDSLR
ncbi:MAG: UvrD-helicase domain-containing protein, partial [Marinomonas sp.]